MRARGGEGRGGGRPAEPPTGGAAAQKVGMAGGMAAAAWKGTYLTKQLSYQNMILGALAHRRRPGPAPQPFGGGGGLANPFPFLHTDVGGPPPATPPRCLSLTPPLPPPAPAGRTVPMYWFKTLIFGRDISRF
eukprot:SAG11_NODE_791_length_7146_cov_49.170427_5_plen_133_part_00